MRKKERRICRNQLSVILIGWGRYRKGRHCRNVKLRSATVWSWVSIIFTFLFYLPCVNSSVDFLLYLTRLIQNKVNLEVL